MTRRFACRARGGESGADHGSFGSRREASRIQILVACALLGVAGGAGGCNRAPPEPAAPPPPEVDVAKPIVREVTEWDEYTGRLAAIDTVEVRPRVSGYLESVHFKEGQIVKKGDLLVVIDPRPFRAVLAAAAADVAGAEARLELARNELERAENLIDARAIAAEDVDRRSKAVVEAQASLDGAKARVDQARLEVEFTEVRAPIDGRTSHYAVTAGNLVSGGSSGIATLLTTIVSLNPIHCYVDASEQDYLKYMRLAISGRRPSSRDKPNPVHVAVADENEFRYPGYMDFVDNRIDPFTGTMRGRAIVENPDGMLVPGLFVRLRLIGESKPGAVLLPDEAIGTDQSKRVVYVVDDKSTVALRTVTTGRLIDGLRVIRSGLDGSETVVVRGLQRVRPGATVAPRAVDLDTATDRPPATGASTSAEQDASR